MTMSKTRIDQLLVSGGFAPSRAKAQAMVMAGVVLADDRRVDKASETFPDTVAIRIKGMAEEMRYVGRGGLKLEAALTHFQIDPSGYECIDIGSSTGGFTDCLLQHGAAHVVAIDAGTNQLDWRLRNDERVEVREKTNARKLVPDDFDRQFDLAVMDVSFISVSKVIPAIVPLLNATARLIVLIKPQFEVGRDDVGKGGIVKDPMLHDQVVEMVNTHVTSLGLKHIGTIDSPIPGAEGNKEFLSAYDN